LFNCRRTLDTITMQVMVVTTMPTNARIVSGLSKTDVPSCTTRYAIPAKIPAINIISAINGGENFPDFMSLPAHLLQSSVLSDVKETFVTQNRL